MEDTTGMRTSTGSFHQNPWFPGFLERMACCAMPPNKVNDMVLPGDSQDDSDGIVDEEEVESNSVVESNRTRRPVSQPLSSRPSLLPEKFLSYNNLPSPTQTPSRRDLDRWNHSCIGMSTCCTPSYAGSTATTASIVSEDDDLRAAEEIRSNATTQVVSHRKHGDQRNQLLSSTLASAEKRLKRQLLEAEARAEALRSTRRQQGQAR